ncbi:MAG: hypothetical protein ACQETH_14445 [Candidatus Rifleibacteriota bacterium]
MKTILLRLLIFILCSMSLGFISQAGFQIEEGKVAVVGRCHVELSGLNTDLEPESDNQILIKSNKVGIAQVSFKSYDGKKPIFEVKKIFSLKTDENGYFLLKNVSKEYSYIMLGAQHHDKKGVPVHSLTLANAREDQGKMINLGFHKIRHGYDKSKSCRYASTQIDTSMKNSDFISYFMLKSPLKKCVSRIKSSNYWGKSNSVTLIDSGKIKLANLQKASWETIDSQSYF